MYPTDLHCQSDAQLQRITGIPPASAFCLSWPTPIGVVLHAGDLAHPILSVMIAPPSLSPSHAIQRPCDAHVVQDIAGTLKSPPRYICAMRRVARPVALGLATNRSFHVPLLGNTCDLR